MSSNTGWLLDNVTNSAKSNEFTVTAGVTRLFGANLGNDIPIQVWVGGDDVGTWVPLARNGKAIVMNDLNNSYIEMVAGIYRVDSTNAGPNARIWYEENYATDGDDRTIYVFNNISGENSSGGGGLSQVTTGAGNNTIVFSGAGTTASPLTAAVKLSTESVNLLKTVSDGITAEFNSLSSQTATFAGLGTSGSPAEVIVNVSSTAGNQISVNSDGLFVPAFTGHKSQFTSGMIPAIHGVSTNLVTNNVVINNGFNICTVQWQATYTNTGFNNDNIQLPYTITDVDSSNYNLSELELQYYDNSLGFSAPLFVGKVLLTLPISQIQMLPVGSSTVYNVYCVGVYLKQ